MTDDELAEELEFHAKHGISAAPALQHEASERIRAISAHVALLKASLAQAEREAEKATASAEPFGYFRVTPFGWEDCAETDDGAIPLYTAPQPDFGARVKAGGPSFHEPGEGGVPCPDGSASEVGIPTSEPVAWAHFAKNGNIRIWASSAKEAVRIAKENGIELIPLYPAPQPDRVAELERELETERMRLAACGAAALGYYDGCADEYRSASLDDVLRLRVEAERMRTLLSEAAEDIQYWGAYASDYLQEKHDLSGRVGKYSAAALAGKGAQS